VTFHPVLPMRAAVVAAAAAALALLALASLSPTAAGLRTLAEAPSFSAPIAARVAYSAAPSVILSRADQ
jgi:hypothetical protein